MSSVVTDTAIIIPVYNEDEVVREVVNRALETFKFVVCVDDGSTDKSKTELLQTTCFLIVHPINMGQGAALQTGIDFAKKLPVEYFATYDSDGQHEIEDIISMREKIIATNSDILLGSRFIGQAVGIKKRKEILLKLAVIFTKLTTGLKLSDTHNGLRIFNRHVAETMKITSPDMSHASEILEIISRNKYNYSEFPVTIRYTEYSAKKGQPIINSVNILFDSILRKFTK